MKNLSNYDGYNVSIELLSIFKYMMELKMKSLLIYFLIAFVLMGVVSLFPQCDFSGADYFGTHNVLIPIESDLSIS